MDPDGLVSVTSTPLPSIPLSSLSFSHFPPILCRLPPPIDHAIPEPSWRIYPSPTSISPSLLTRHKTTDRSMYDEARSFIPPSSQQGEYARYVLSEVLVFNLENEVMEGSISTPYFWRQGRWVTPPASAGGNLGTTRMYALATGLCVEETVRKQTITHGEAIWLSNGARGWGWGRMELLEDRS